MTDDEIATIFYPMRTCTPNERLIAIAIGRAIERKAERQALERAAQARQELIDGDELDVEQKSGAYDARNAIRALIEQSAKEPK